MWHELREKTKYEVKLGDSGLEKRIASAELFTSLDEPSRFTVIIATRAELLAALSPDSLPQTASFSWNDKPLFQGHLAATKVVGHHRLQLEYSDELRLAKRTSENEFFKQQTLREVLEKLCKWVGLKASFVGSFSELLPGFSLGDRSLFDLMKELSYTYGFFFVSKSPTNGVTFFSLGQQVSTKNIDASKVVFDTELDQTAERAVDAVEVSYFDSAHPQGVKREVAQAALYKPLGGLTGHPGCAAKLKWKLAKGRMETHVTNSSQYDDAERAFRSQLSKQLMEQEQFRLSCFEPLASAGDKIELSKATAGNLENGAYLIRSSRVVVGSSLPKLELMAIRP